MIKLLFVCHGNICRSPMAEFVMKDMVEREGLRELFRIASAAVSDEEIGNPVHSGTRRKLAEHGIDCAGKTARQMTRADYAHYDMIIGMDASNMRRMQRICGGDPEGRLYLLLDFAGLNRDVADPWYTGDFEQTWRDVELGCRALLEKIRGEKL